MDQEKLFKKMHNLTYNDEVKEDEFIFFIEQNKEEMLKIDPILFIGMHVDFYLQKDKISKALEVINIYKNGKYISMEVEDFLDELKYRIFKELDRDKQSTIEDNIFSSNLEANIKALASLSNENLNNHIDLIRRFLEKKNNEKLHRLLLLNLVSQKIDKEFTFILNEKKVLLNPSKLILPEKTKKFNKVLNIIEKKYQKNPSKLKQMVDIFMSLNYVMYPYNPFTNIDEDMIIEYIEYLCSYVCGNRKNLNKNLDIDKIEELEKMLLK